MSGAIKTEHEWLTSTSAAEMMKYLQSVQKHSRRKAGLFHCALGRRQPEFLRRGFSGAGQITLSLQDLVDCERLCDELPDHQWSLDSFGPFRLLHTTILQLPIDGQPDMIREIWGNPFRRPGWFFETMQRNLYGDHSDVIHAVAQSIYDQRAWEDMPILADALEEAGCTDEDALQHARGNVLKVLWTRPGEGRYGPMPAHGDPASWTMNLKWKKGAQHTRGCWLLDLILGKM